MVRNMQVCQPPEIEPALIHAYELLTSPLGDMRRGVPDVLPVVLLAAYSTRIARKPVFTLI